MHLYISDCFTQFLAISKAPNSELKRHQEEQKCEFEWKLVEKEYTFSYFQWNTGFLTLKLCMFEKTGKYHLFHAKAKANLNQAKYPISNDCYEKISKCRGIKRVKKLTQIMGNRVPLLKPVKPFPCFVTWAICWCLDKRRWITYKPPCLTASAV